MRYETEGKPIVSFSTYSEERFANEVNELGRSPDKLLKDRSLQRSEQKLKYKITGHKLILG